MSLLDNIEQIVAAQPFLAFDTSRRGDQRLPRPSGVIIVPAGAWFIWRAF